MRRVNSVRLSIVTGRQGSDEPVRIRVNGVELTLHRISGGTEAGESYEGEYFVACPVKTCELLGPESGRWEIREIEVEYIDADDRSSIVKLGGATLDTGGSIDILGEDPGHARAFEV